MAKSNVEQVREQTAGRRGKFADTLAPAVVGDDSALVTAPPAGVPMWSDTVALDPEMIQIPYLKLAQGLSAEVTRENATAKMGDWLLPGYPEEKAVVVVPIQFGQSRTYAEKGEDGSFNILCQSPVGHEHGIGQPGIPCAECPLKNWQPTDRVNERGQKVNAPPPCQAALEFVAWDETHQTVVRLSFRSTATQAGKQLAMLGATRGLGNFPVKLSSARKSGKFTYAVPVIELIPQSEWGDSVQKASEMKQLLMQGAPAEVEFNPEAEA